MLYKSTDALTNKAVSTKTKILIVTLSHFLNAGLNQTSGNANGPKANIAIMTHMGL